RDLLELYYSVPAAYRQVPTFAFVGSDSFAKACRAIVDGMGRPLWEPSLQTDAPDRLFGRPFIVNHHMAAMGTVNAKVAVAGDFNQFLVRDVGNFELITDPYSRMATNRQIVLSGHGAVDSKVLNTSALK